MWRKIRSNRHPGDTLYSELQKEFSYYFNRVAGAMQRILVGYPRVVLFGMITSLVVSGALSFTVLRQREKRSVKITAQHGSPLQDGFGQLLEVTGRIRETLRLKHEVDSLTAKRTLTSQDSAALDSALTRLQMLRPK